MDRWTDGRREGGTDEWTGQWTNQSMDQHTKLADQEAQIHYIVLKGWVHAKNLQASMGPGVTNR